VEPGFFSIVWGAYIRKFLTFREEEKEPSAEEKLHHPRYGKRTPGEGLGKIVYLARGKARKKEGRTYTQSLLSAGANTEGETPNGGAAVGRERDESRLDVGETLA